MINKVINRIKDYYYLYRLDNNFYVFIRSVFINKYLHYFEYHPCDACTVALRKPLWIGVQLRLFCLPWYCERCQGWIWHMKSCKEEQCWQCNFIKNALAEKRREYIKFWSQADEQGRVRLF